jgi:hypothetical protein
VNTIGVEISIIKPNIQRTKRKGGGTKADINHNTAATEKPIEYRLELKYNILQTGVLKAAAIHTSSHYFIHEEIIEVRS